MSFEEKYRKASFRGVPFHFFSGGDDFGRRTVVHEYPLRDKGFTEDLGKKAGRFELRAFVFGQDFLAEAKNLIDTCTKPGPGVLVHPLLGSITVVCNGCRPNYTTRQKGMVEFRLSFYEEGENRYPAANDDYQELAAQKAAGCLQNFEQYCVESINVEGPGWLSSELGNELTTALTMIEGVVTILLNPSAATGAILDVTARLKEQAQVNAGGGETAAASISTAMGGLGTIALSGDRRALSAALELTRYGLDSTLQPTQTVIPQTTTARQTQAQNQRAIQDQLRQSAAAQAVQAAVNMEFNSKQHAQRVRDQVVDRLDTLLTLAGESYDDQGYEEIRSLSAHAVKAFDQIISRQTPAKQIRVPTAVSPALCLAYDLYEDIGREGDILNRNPGVFHPGVLPSGENVEVLCA